MNNITDTNVTELAEVQRDKKEIHTYSLVDTLLELQAAVLDGYTLDVETNEGYPQLFGTHYIINVYKDAKSLDEVLKDNEVSTETPSKAPAGLKLKGRKAT